MTAMFRDCTSLVSVTLTPQVTSASNMGQMFYKCGQLTTIYVGSNWTTNSVETSTDMFNSCTSLVGGNGTVYDASKIDKTYARIDKEGTPGYFTEKTI